MDNPVVKAAFLLAIPLVVFGGGLYLLSRLSGQEYVKRQVRDRADPKDRKPLYARFTGYTAEEVRRYWGALDNRAWIYEQRFLKWDLGFAFVYGVVLGAVLIYAWLVLGKSFRILPWLLPLMAAVAADWTENLVHLDQLRAFAETGGAGLNPTWIRVGSVATTMKWVSLAIVGCVLLWLAGKIVMQSRIPP